jgi:thymidine kinase
MSLELIIGPMFAGKTSAIQTIIRRHEALGIKYAAYKPAIDKRYGEDSFIYNHDSVKVAAQSVTYLGPNRDTEQYASATLIIIEEGQFFLDLYVFVACAVEEDGKHVVVAGLDGDRFRKPFGQILNLIPIADKVTKLTAFCKGCATEGYGIVPAIFTYGSTKSVRSVEIGGADIYEPVCRSHYLASISQQPQVPGGEPPTN